MLRPEPKFSILVTFDHVGFHCWPKAPSIVDYLRNEHRHLFKFRVELAAEHQDRALEVHQVRQVCEFWATSQMDKGTSSDSCETMAWKLLKCLRTNFQPLRGRVEVWEDGECGGACEMEWAPEPSVIGG